MVKKRKRKKKKSPSAPKPRHVWEIDPTTRIKPSAKVYRRPKEKKKSWIDDVKWFGEI